LRRKWKDECGAALAAGDGTAERLRLEAPELLHEIGRLHQSHVGKVQVAKDLILEATGTLLAGTRQVDAAGVTAQAFLVVNVVVVDTRRLCIIHKITAPIKTTFKIFLPADEKKPKQNTIFIFKK
jgi:hypothetical protein